jgi:hypothetical protein
MMLETSAHCAQPTVAPFPFTPQGWSGIPLGPYGQPVWPLLGGPLSHPQSCGPLALSGQGIGGWFPPPFGGGSPLIGLLAQYGLPGGQGIGGLTPPFGGGSPLIGPLAQYGPLAVPFLRLPQLEAHPSMTMTPAFAPHGFLGGPLIGSPGGFSATFAPRGFGSAGLPFQPTPQLAYGG